MRKPLFVDHGATVLAMYDVYCTEMERDVMQMRLHVAIDHSSLGSVRSFLNQPLMSTSVLIKSKVMKMFQLK